MGASLGSSQRGSLDVELNIVPFIGCARARALREFVTSGDLPPVEVAASSSDAHPIAYTQLITAMDTAVRVGYPRVGVTDPQSLSR
jgi:hypothetical protein